VGFSRLLSVGCQLGPIVASILGLSYMRKSEVQPKS
jgi:hypothetical protein